MMIAEEEGLKKRLMSSIEACRKEVASLCDELQVQECQVSVLFICMKSWVKTSALKLPDAL